MKYFLIMCHSAFNVWPKTTLLLPVWPRDAKRVDTPASVDQSLAVEEGCSYCVVRDGRNGLKDNFFFFFFFKERHGLVYRKK